MFVYLKYQVQHVWFKHRTCSVARMKTGSGNIQKKNEAIYQRLHQKIKKVIRIINLIIRIIINDISIDRSIDRQTRYSPELSSQSSSAKGLGLLLSYWVSEK